MDSKNSTGNSLFSGFFFHLHPRTIPPETLRFTLSFGLGGMAALLVVTLVLTGVHQLLSYSPQPSTAYQSIRHMYDSGNPAGFIRNIHYWAGNLLVIVSALHLLRVFLTGALNKERRYNWLIGVALFILVLLANFSGYLLPWDQLAYWAVTIFTTMASYIPLIGGELVSILRGGNEIGQPTLANFFAIHIGVIPFLLTILLIFHFWLVRKAGGLARSNDSEGTGNSGRIPAIPFLIQREAAVGLCLLALLLFFAAVTDAPLDKQANPGMSPNPAKAAWYFMGLQELLLHLHPSYAICVIPSLMIICLMAIPFWRSSVLPAGTWFGGKRGIHLAIIVFTLGFLFTLLAVILDDFFFRSLTSTEIHVSWLTRGVIPTLLVIFGSGALFMFLRRKRYSRAESVMALVLLHTALICGLTMVGIWFRGPGMALVLPGMEPIIP